MEDAPPKRATRGYSLTATTKASALRVFVRGLLALMMAPPEPPHGAQVIPSPASDLAHKMVKHIKLSCAMWD
jgi:hypothetical protein